MSIREESREILTQERDSNRQRQESMLERAEQQEAQNADEQANITQDRARELVNNVQIEAEKRQKSMSERLEEAIEKSPVANPDSPD
ncbi:MAG: hypothetical protein SWJ54_07030 [Cyanobacteriota bacterium]|nr:hypothetical protein [Cyanobacteriota bacterium]